MAALTGQAAPECAGGLRPAPGRGDDEQVSENGEGVDRCGPHCHLVGVRAAGGRTDRNRLGNRWAHPRRYGGRNHLVQGHPLRGAADGEFALAGPAAGEAVDGHQEGGSVRPGVHAAGLSSARSAAPHRQRGLPLSQRVDSRELRGRASPGHGLDLRRRLYGRVGEPAGLRRHPFCAEGCRTGESQLPARRVRLSRGSRARCRIAPQRIRELWNRRHGRRPEVGQGQHRAIWRGSLARHGLR